MQESKSMFFKLKKYCAFFRSDQQGSMLFFVLIFGSLAFTCIVLGVAGFAIIENRASYSKQNREMAFQIAEAGVNYYRWHLAHNKTDYQDGTGLPGPYVHAYTDKNGTVIGHYSLTITPPASGSTVVTIQSTGWLDAQSATKRTIKVRVGFPSLTDYALLTNTDAWIGPSEVTHGKFHSNGGIRFDGVGDAQITSAVPTYTCRSYHGCNNVTKPGVWGAGGPSSLWSYPVPAQDFTAVTAKLSEIKAGAQVSGLYLASSGKQGWRLQFVSDGTVKASKVTATNCYTGTDVNASQSQFYCIDIKTQGTATTYTVPTNGLIYVDDTVWVDGVVKGRATVGVATGKSIIINGNVTYLAKDGTHVLGLIAEQNVLIPHDSPASLEIDAAMLAQNGGTKRYYYSNNVKTNLAIYGAVISAGTWTWSWVDAYNTVISGYQTTNSTYDVNLTYNPPPGFPVGSEYNLISWDEY
jgi:hypothetical protein